MAEQPPQTPPPDHVPGREPNGEALKPGIQQLMGELSGLEKVPAMHRIIRKESDELAKAFRQGEDLPENLQAKGLTGEDWGQVLRVYANAELLLDPNPRIRRTAVGPEDMAMLAMMQRQAEEAQQAGAEQAGQIEQQMGVEGGIGLESLGGYRPMRELQKADREQLMWMLATHYHPRDMVKRYLVRLGNIDRAARIEQMATEIFEAHFFDDPERDALKGMFLVHKGRQVLGSSSYEHLEERLAEIHEGKKFLSEFLAFQIELWVKKPSEEVGERAKLGFAEAIDVLEENPIVYRNEETGMELDLRALLLSPDENAVRLGEELWAKEIWRRALGYGEDEKLWEEGTEIRYVSDPSRIEDLEADRLSEEEKEKLFPIHSPFFEPDYEPVADEKGKVLGLKESPTGKGQKIESESDMNKSLIWMQKGAMAYCLGLGRIKAWDPAIESSGWHYQLRKAFNRINYLMMYSIGNPESRPYAMEFYGGFEDENARKIYPQLRMMEKKDWEQGLVRPSDDDNREEREKKERENKKRARARRKAAEFVFYDAGIRPHLATYLDAMAMIKPVENEDGSVEEPYKVVIPGHVMINGIEGRGREEKDVEVVLKADNSKAKKTYPTILTANHSLVDFRDYHLTRRVLTENASYKQGWMLRPKDSMLEVARGLCNGDNQEDRRLYAQLSWEAELRAMKVDEHKFVYDETEVEVICFDIADGDVVNTQDQGFHGVARLNFLHDFVLSGDEWKRYRNAEFAGEALPDDWRDRWVGKRNELLSNVLSDDEWRVFSDAGFSFDNLPHDWRKRFESARAHGVDGIRVVAENFSRRQAEISRLLMTDWWKWYYYLSSSYGSSTKHFDVLASINVAAAPNWQDVKFIDYWEAFKESVEMARLVGEEAGGYGYGDSKMFQELSENALHHAYDLAVPLYPGQMGVPTDMRALESMSSQEQWWYKKRRFKVETERRDNLQELVDLLGEPKEVLGSEAWLCTRVSNEHQRPELGFRANKFVSFLPMVEDGHGGRAPDLSRVELTEGRLVGPGGISIFEAEDQWCTYENLPVVARSGARQLGSLQISKMGAVVKDKNLVPDVNGLDLVANSLDYAHRHGMRRDPEITGAESSKRADMAQGRQSF